MFFSAAYLTTNSHPNQMTMTISRLKRMASASTSYSWFSIVENTLRPRQRNTITKLEKRKKTFRMILTWEPRLINSRPNPTTRLIFFRNPVVMSRSNPPKFFLALQSFCCRLSVVLLSYYSRSTLIRLWSRRDI